MFQISIAKSLVTLLITFLLTLLKNLVMKQADSVKEYFQKNSNSKPTEGKSTTRTNLQVRQHAGLSTYMLNQLIIIN